MLTWSEFSAFQACQQRWLYRYPQQLSPLEEHDGGRLLGTAYHAGVEAIEKGASVEAAQVAAIAAMSPSIEDLIEPTDEEAEERATLEWMVRHYAEATQEERANFVPVAAEQVFTVHVPRVDGTRGPLVITGRIDRVYFDAAHDDIVIVDHKTIDRDFIAQERRAETSGQITMYMLALRAITQGPIARSVPRRAVHYVMRRARPRKPKINKDGSVSVATCDTDLETWDAALAAMPQDKITDKHLAIRGDIAAQGDRFFRRIPTYRTEWEIDRFARELYAQAAQMREIERRPEKAVRNTSHCYAYGRRCEYWTLCTARPGVDVDVSALYRRREHRHEELVTAEEET